MKSRTVYVLTSQKAERRAFGMEVCPRVVLVTLDREEASRRSRNRNGRQIYLIHSHKVRMP